MLPFQPKLPTFLTPSFKLMVDHINQMLPEYFKHAVSTVDYTLERQFLVEVMVNLNSLDFLTKIQNFDNYEIGLVIYLERSRSNLYDK